MKTVRWLVSLAAALLVAPVARAQDPFPHDRHAKLFPNCEACHSGVISGRADRVLPNPRQCESCHNGTDAKRVEWTPRQRPSQGGLLRFSHVEHASKTDSAGRSCGNCHADAGAPRMQVSAARAPRCFSCHTHRTTAHYDESNSCNTCHVPLTAATALSASRVAQLPRPATHEDANFIATHGLPSGGKARSMASCATCHARESCVRCHLNGQAIPAINTLGRDARVAAVVRGKRASYPRPASHTVADFVATHGSEAARQPARCASCHAQPSCRTCHTGTGARKTIDALPLEPRDPGAGRGVQLQRASLPPGSHTTSDWSRPVAAASPVAPSDTGVHRVRVHVPGFERVHATAARSAALTCEGCHTQSMCASCHTGERTRSFHVANFAMRHAATAYSRETDCASCHNTETFCRSCHQTTGVGARGNASTVYHNAESQWLLQHGRAARQSLTTCTSCHQQRDCMQCHSTLGWGVNPHGPGFDAARLWKQAKTMCLRCHLSDPTK